MSSTLDSVSVDRTVCERCCTPLRVARSLCELLYVSVVRTVFERGCTPVSMAHSICARYCKLVCVARTVCERCCSAVVLYTREHGQYWF